MPAALVIANSGAGIRPNEEGKGESAGSQSAADEPTGPVPFSD